MGERTGQSVRRLQTDEVPCYEAADGLLEQERKRCNRIEPIQCVKVNKATLVLNQEAGYCPVVIVQR